MEYNLGQFPTLSQSQMDAIPQFLCTSTLTGFNWQDGYLFAVSTQPLIDSEVSSLQVSVNNIQSYIDAQAAQAQAQRIAAIKSLTVGPYLSVMDIILAMRAVILAAPDFATLQANMATMPLINQILTNKGLPTD